MTITACGMHLGCQATFRMPYKLLALVCLSAYLGGCATAKIEDSQFIQSGALPRPDMIYVDAFSFSPDDVSAQSAIGARLLDLAKGTSSTEQELEIGDAVAQKLSNEVVSGLRALGLPAQHAPDQEVAGTGLNILRIEGQFLKVEEGNRLRRVLIGLGAGHSVVNTYVQVYETTPAGRILVLQFTTDARSSRKPGAAETAAIGVAAAGVSAGVGAGTDFNQTAVADARRTAHLIVSHLGSLAYQRGWITAEAVAEARTKLHSH